MSETRATAAVRKPPEPYPAAGRAAVFVALSVPLLAGFYLWGGVVLFVWGVIPIAAAFGPRVWPKLTGVEAAAIAALVAALAWMPAVAIETNLLIPLCGPDLAGVVKPAAIVTGTYLVVGLVGALKQWVSLWVAAGVLVPVAYAVATQWLDAPLTC